MPFYRNRLFWTILGTVLTFAFAFGLFGIKLRLDQKKKLEPLVNKKVEEGLVNAADSDLNTMEANDPPNS